MTPPLTVVMPVHNEARQLPATIDALADAVRRSGWGGDVVVVDDGSTDGSADVAREVLAERLPLTIVRHENLGRFEARRTGVEAASGEFILLLDARVHLDSESLAFARERVDAGERVWTSHVDVRTTGNPYGLFWSALAELAWRDYFRDPKTTSFGVDDFDRFPKGTTAFLAPRELLLEAIRHFRTRYSDTRFANDDTPLIRWIAAQERVHVSPRYRSSYTARSTLATFGRHSVHRGIVFLDGHGRPESRFFPVAVAFFPLSAALVALGARRPSILAAAAAAAAVGAGSAALAAGVHQRSARSALVVGVLAPLYALAHGAGMWIGAGMALRRFAARRG